MKKKLTVKERLRLFVEHAKKEIEQNKQPDLVELSKKFKVPTLTAAAFLVKDN